MTDSGRPKPLVLGIDAGGTMTDTLVVDEEGRFVVGKAATTPHDESVGLLESVEDALSYIDGRPIEEFFSELEVCLYSGTTMLNTLLSRSGEKLGVLVTKGFEDMIHQGRGMQSYAEYSYADRLHTVTHVHPQALVPKRGIFGVTERIDMAGTPVIPLYEHEVREAVLALLEQDVDALCVCFLMSYLNPLHEELAGTIAHDLVTTAGRPDLPIFLSSQVRPVTREVSRANSTLIEAYAAAPVRVQLQRVEEEIQERGFKGPLQTMLSYGGLANIRYPRLHETLISGPVGGVLGAQYMSRLLGAKNLVLTDLGGTSFDIAAITEGSVPVDPEPTIARFKLNLPTIALESIGAGAGTIVKVDPATRKIELGPESAGSAPGPVAFDRGGTRATVCDCDVVLGYLNPENFLGGKVRLDVEKAAQAVREQITDPLGVDLYEGAEGIVRLLEGEAREALRRMVSSRGFDLSEYQLLAYGGAGPLHMAGYTRGLHFEDVITFPFAAAFSAFGCTTADYSHRYQRSVHMQLPPDADEAAKAHAAEELNTVWAELSAAARTDMEAEGRDLGQLAVTPIALIRYTGQLDDVSVVAPQLPLQGAAAFDALLAAWEMEYERINRRVSRYEEAGYSITEVALVGTIPKIQPRIVAQELSAPTPPADARKADRRMFWGGEWRDASVWDIERMVPGNEVHGPALLEHPATTYLVPPGHHTWLDEYTIFHFAEVS